MSCAAALHASLQALRAHPDADLLDIVQLMATKPMQVRTSGDLARGCHPQIKVCPLLEDHLKWILSIAIACILDTVFSSNTCLTVSGSPAQPCHVLPSKCGLFLYCQIPHTPA